MANQDIFISYSRKDSDIADRICKAFDNAGITYFIDRQGIGGGMEFPKVLAEAIMSCKIFLYLGSENSYASKFTNSEITYAFNKKPKEQILPYIIDNSTLPAELEFVFSCINIRNIKEHPIETTLVQDVLQMLGQHIEPQAIQSKSSRKRMTIGIVAAGIAAMAFIFLIAYVMNKETENVAEHPETVSTEETIVIDEKVEDPDFIFNTEQEVRAFLSGKAFESPQGVWFAFNEDLTVKLSQKGSSEGMTISDFKVKDIKGDSATLEITYYTGPQATKFVDILECIDGKVSININGGGYKYYALD